MGAFTELGERHLDGENRTVLAPGEELAGIADSPRSACLEITGNVAVVLFPVRRRHQQADVLPDRLLGGIAEHPLRSRIEGGNDALLVSGDNRIGRRVYDGADPGFLLLQIGPFDQCLVLCNPGINPGLRFLPVLFRMGVGKAPLFGEVVRRLGNHVPALFRGDARLGWGTSVFFPIPSLPGPSLFRTHCAARGLVGIMEPFYAQFMRISVVFRAFTRMPSDGNYRMMPPQIGWPAADAVILEPSTYA